MKTTVVIDNVDPVSVDVINENNISIELSLTNIGPQGIQGETGSVGPANTLSIGTVTGGATAAATITGTSPNQTLNLTLPKGDKGDTGEQGLTGSAGADGQANTLSIGTVTGGTTAAATITGDAPNQTLNLTLPKGDKGEANTLTIGTVTGGATASATITGTAPNQTLNLTLPKGDKGDTGEQGIQGEQGLTGASNTLAIGTVTSGTIAAATITGTSPNQTLNLTLPKGDKGDTGEQGLTGSAGADGADGVGVPEGGATGQVLAKASATNYDTEWVNRLIPSGGITTVAVVSALPSPPDANTLYIVTG